MYRSKDIFKDENKHNHFQTIHNSTGVANDILEDEPKSCLTADFLHVLVKVSCL